MAYIGQYPPAHNSTYVLSTTEDSNGFSPPYFATDPALSLTGAGLYNSWVSAYFESTNQKFNIALSSSKAVRRIYLENYHNSGSLVDRGVNNFTVYGTNELTAFQNTTYANTTDLTLLGTFQADAHNASDASDPQYFDLSSNSTAYQYYVFRFADNQGSSNSMNIRHLEVQIDDSFEVHNPSGGAVAGGEALVHPDELIFVGSGGAVGGGIATKSHGFISIGGAVVGGEALQVHGFVGSGGGIAGGSAVINNNFTLSGSGGAIGGGAASIILTFMALVDGSIGFKGKIEVNQWLNSLKGAIGFNSDIEISQEGSSSLNGLIGFNGVIATDQPISLTLIGSIGLGGLVNINQDERLSLSGSFGINGSIDIANQNLFNITGGIGFDSQIIIAIDDSSDYSLALHNSTRWT